MPDNLILRIVFAILGTIALIVLSPLVIIGIAALFIRNTLIVKRCENCQRWFADSGELCGQCEIIFAMERHRAESEMDGPWQNIMDDRSRGMDIALATDDYGIWHIGQGKEDPMTIEWKILGRDM